MIETYTVKYSFDGVPYSFDYSVNALRAVCRRWLYYKLSSMVCRFPSSSYRARFSDVRFLGPPLDLSKASELRRFYLPF